jgi:hypothetical protein
MGLDMYLEARKFVSAYRDKPLMENLAEALGGVYESMPVNSNTSDPHGFMSINLEAMYWRKANAIHDWFVRNVQNGEDDCKSYPVSREQLQELVQDCRKVLMSGADPEVAQEVLPTATGFFFGGTEYDQYYYEELDNTIKAVEQLLNDEKLKDYDFYYQSSW